MECLAECLAALGGYDDVMQLVTVVEGMAAQLVGDTGKGDALQLVAFGKGVALYLLHACRHVYIVQFVTVVEGIVPYLLYTACDDDILEFLLAAERHLADNLYAFGDGEALFVAHAVYEALFSRGINGIFLTFETVAVYLLQRQVEYEVLELAVFFRTFLLQNLKDSFLVLFHNCGY